MLRFLILLLSLYTGAGLSADVEHKTDEILIGQLLRNIGNIKIIIRAGLDELAEANFDGNIC